MRSYEIGVETVASGISVGQHEWLLSLAWGPLVGEERGVPVDFVEEMRLVLPALRAVTIGWESHVGLVRIKALRGVVAGREVDVSAEGRGVAVAVLVREADTGTSVSWILDSHSMKTVRVGGI